MFFLLQSLFFLNITSNSSYACSSVALVMSELAAAPPDGRTPRWPPHGLAGWPEHGSRTRKPPRWPSLKPDVWP
jgi:hypothetical protein